MGLLSLFKKGKEEVNLAELSIWLAKHEPNLTDDFAGIKCSLIELNENARRLGLVDIDAQKVEPRLKALVKDHRKAYISAINGLVSSIVIPSTYNAKEMYSFIAHLEESLLQFSKKTLKNYHVLKSLIGRELEDIKCSLTNLSRAGLELKKKIKRIEVLEGIHSRLREIDAILNLKNSLAELSNQRAELEERKEKINKDIAGLKAGSMFKEYEQLKLEREKIEKELYDLESEVKNAIAALSRPLKKFAKTNPESASIICCYLEEPVPALIRDERNDISGILERLEAGGSAAGIIKAFNPPLLRTRHNELAFALKKIGANLNSNQFEIKLNSFLNNLRQINNAIAQNSEKMQRIESASMHQAVKNLEDDIKKLGKEVKIKIEGDK